MKGLSKGRYVETFAGEDGVWVLQRVKYVTPHFFFLKNKNIKLRLLKWYLTYSNWLNSHLICKNSLFFADTDIY